MYMQLQSLILCTLLLQLFRLAHLLGLDGVETPVAMPTAGIPMASGQGHTSILIANAAIEVRCGKSVAI